MRLAVLPLLFLFLWGAVWIASTVEGAAVFLEKLELYTTNDLPMWTPSVYFQCEGEERKALTGVEEKRHPYNFSFHESFQPLTELEPPRCKRCGLYEADTWTEDDVFEKWELCPLDFAEPPSGRYFRVAQKEFNLTLYCKECNTQNSYAKGVMFAPADSVSTSPLLIFGIVLGSALGISTLVVLLAYFFQRGVWPFRRRLDADTVKFMEMFDEEDEFLQEDEEDDLELADYHHHHHHHNHNHKEPGTGPHRAT